MKRLFSILMLLALSMPMFAQKDVTKFLGIPVDGSKSEMIRKLKAKGFTEISYSDMLRGEFNGKNVNVKVVTNNNKVYRIFVVDAYPVSETDIKINFNKLYRQFEDNKNYISPSDLSISDKDEREIPESEDISYEMTVNNKSYYVCLH